MGPERDGAAGARRPVGALLAAFVAAALLPAPAAGAAAPSHAWWEPLALHGREVPEVASLDGRLAVRTDGDLLTSVDGGSTLHGDPGARRLLERGGCTRARACRAPRAGGGSWTLEAGRVVSTAPAGPPVPLPGSPDLGAGAALIAAPAAMNGVMVVVSAGNAVWRRSPDGTWGRSLLLLPAGLLGPVPRITSVAAFDRPVSGTVYLGIDGYGVLTTHDGGERWERAGPGLPDRVLALAADAAGRVVYAGTDDGLWVHHLQPLPGPPAYASGDLVRRWVAVIALSAAASAAALVWLERMMRPG